MYLYLTILPNLSDYDAPSPLSGDPVLNIRSHHYYYDTLTWDCSLIGFMVAETNFFA
jgi:hypothetical protein